MRRDKTHLSWRTRDQEIAGRTGCLTTSDGLKREMVTQLFDQFVLGDIAQGFTAQVDLPQGHFFNKRDANLFFEGKLSQR